MKKLLTLVLAVLMIASSVPLAIPASASSAFGDVNADRWSAGAIRYVSEKGYMLGTSDGVFSPDAPVTRAAVATVLWRRQGAPRVVPESGFSDVRSDAWYAHAVAWARKAGVVFGLTDTSFDPDGAVSREQLAAMLFRYSALCPVSVPERADLSGFDDASAVSDWAGEAIGWAVQATLIEGVGDGLLDPSGTATREHLAAILERFDGVFTLAYNSPVLVSHHTEKEYPLVGDADFYVSATGSDENDGSFDYPFATFEKAAEAVRELKKTKTGDITVAFFAGNYGPLAVELTEEDSGSATQSITYCKYGDGDVIFDNGATLAESAFLPLDDGEKAAFQPRCADLIKKVDLREYLDVIPGYDDFVLFGNGSILTPARFPNKYDDGSDNLLAGGETYDRESILIENRILKNRLSSYSDGAIADMRLYGYIILGYRKDAFKTESFDRSSGILTVDEQSLSEIGVMRDGWRGADGTGILMAFLNVPYELDAPGEFYVDRTTSTLYVFDPHGDYRIPLGAGEKKIRGVDFDSGTGEALSAEYVTVDLENTGYITFRGLNFENSAGCFMFGYKTTGVTLDRCSFSGSTGKNQVLFEYSLDGEPIDLCVTDCEFDYSVGTSIWVLDDATGPGRYSDPSDILIDNCLFSRANLAYDVEGAVNLYRCSGGHVCHNRFENCCRCGVMYQYSTDIVIEYNDFHSVMTNSEDGGVTRTWGNMDGCCIIRYNLYDSIISSGGVGRHAQYSDDGDCGTIMYSNLYYNSGGIILAGAGRDNVYRDNAVIGNSVVIVQSYTSGIKEAGDEARGSWPLYVHLNRWAAVLNYCETVPGYAEALEERRPGATSFSFDFTDPWDPNFVFAPVNVITNNRYINAKGEGEEIIILLSDAADYCTVEDNIGYTLSENPIFVNPTLGDYRIREGVDFPDIHFELIGRY